MPSYVLLAFFRACVQGPLVYLYLVMSEYVLVEGNELLIGWGSYSVMIVVVQDNFTALPLCCGHNEVDFAFGWRRHCFTYKTGEYIKVNTHKF